MGMFGPTKQEQIETLTSELSQRNRMIRDIGLALEPMNTAAICLFDGRSVLDATKTVVAAFGLEMQKTAELRSRLDISETAVRTLREAVTEISEMMAHWTPSDENLEDLPEPLRNYILELKDVIKKQFNERVEGPVKDAEDNVDEPNTVQESACDCPADYTCPICIKFKLGG